MKKYFVTRKIDSNKSEILATFDSEAQAKAYRHPIYKTSITSWDVPDAAKTLRELAITDLSYRVAEVIDWDKGPIENFQNPIPSKVKHYVMRGEKIMGSMLKNSSLRDEMAEKLSEKIGYPVKIVSPEGPANKDNVLDVTDASDLLSPGVKNLISRKYYSAVVEYNEERPVKSGRLAAFERWAKKKLLTLLWKSTSMKAYAMGHVNARFGLPTSLLFKIRESWTNEIFTRRITPILSLGISCTEEELSDAGKFLSGVIETQYGDSVMGTLGGPSKIRLADTVGDGRNRYILWIGLAVKAQLADVLSELVRSKGFFEKETAKRYLLLNENGRGHPYSEQTFPKVEVEEVS